MRRSIFAFTIVEVLIALAIFILAAVMLGTAYVSVINAYEHVGRAGTVDHDVRFAKQMLLAEPDLETVEKGGDFESDKGARVHWTATVEPTNTADLFSVTFKCEVNRSDLSKPEVKEETFRVLRPTWSKPDEREKLRMAVRDRIQKAMQAAVGK